MMQNRRRLPLFLTSMLAVALMIFGTADAYAQQVFGSILGTATDPSGAPVANAKVSITDQDKGSKFDTTTNESGNFVRGNLIPGTYKVEVEATGFKKAVTPGVSVGADRESRIDAKLEVGSVSDSVEVSAAAPLLQSDRAEVSTTYTTKQLEELPILDRNLQSFQLLTPGTQRFAWQQNSSEDPQGALQLVINGQNFAGGGFSLDGTDNTEPILGLMLINPTIDSVTELKIASQNYDAEFGLAAAGLLLFSTKSGSNNFHGSAFEYIRNNSPGFQDFGRNPFSPAENKGVAPLKWNQFGGSIGGPILKNRLFAFGDAQLTRRRSGGSVTTAVPTGAARNGDLSGYINGGNNQIYDPATGDQTTGLGRTPFTNNVIPASRISPQAAAFIKLFPLPNAPGDPGFAYRNNYSAQESEALDSEQWNTREDWIINDKSSLFGRYSVGNFRKTSLGIFGLGGGPNAFGGAGISNVADKSLAIGYNRAISPTLYTEVRYGYNQYYVSVTPPDVGTSPAKDAGVPGLNLDNFYTSGLPAMYIQGDGGSNLGYALNVNSCNCPLFQHEHQNEIVNNTTKVWKNHSIKFGEDFRWANQLRVPSDNHRSGELQFNTGYTGLVNSGGSVQNGLGWATFLLGEVTTLNRYVSTSTNAQENQKRFFFYGQDTWRATNKLTINYGLRWEQIFPETVNAPGNGGAVDLSTGLVSVLGVGGIPLSGLQKMSWNHFAPRLGAAYQVSKKTVVRVGYGWAYSLGTWGNTFGHNLTQNLPVLENQNVVPSSNFGGVFTLAQGPPNPAFPQPDSSGHFPLPNGVTPRVRDTSVVLPRVMAYNGTVQHQIGDKISLQAGYVGNQGRHVILQDSNSYNVNQAAFIPGSTLNASKPYFAKYGWTQSISYYCNCSSSSYDSLQAQVTVRSWHGMTMVGNYTLQRGINDLDNYSFLYNRALGRGNVPNLSRDVFTAPFTYELPFGKGKALLQDNKVASTVLGGWTVNLISTYQTGTPFTPSIGTFPAGFTTRPYTGPASRPDVGTVDPFAGAPGGRNGFIAGLYTVPGVASSGLSGAWGVPAANIFGNFPINSLFGPRFVNFDMSASRNIRLREGINLQVRAEAFNAFNHTNLGGPNTNLTDPNVGKITSNGGTMRRLQFGARIDF
jgi:Carboxypeptidase regulatory-like domain